MKLWRTRRVWDCADSIRRYHSVELSPLAAWKIAFLTPQEPDFLGFGPVWFCERFGESHWRFASKSSQPLAKVIRELKDELVRQWWIATLKQWIRKLKDVLVRQWSIATLKQWIRKLKDLPVLQWCSHSQTVRKLKDELVLQWCIATLKTMNS